MMTEESNTVLRFLFHFSKQATSETRCRQCVRHANFQLSIITQRDKNLEIYTKGLAPKWCAHSSTAVENQTIQTGLEATPIKTFFPQVLGRLLLARSASSDRQAAHV